eukprot:Seg17027.1 transcript_id=Seg17027.1/GoldUCD/mRNA.D3Y31 product="hypothetical protein" protein_id=Seg17027.1/GoldUCD/D3Y31
MKPAEKLSHLPPVPSSAFPKSVSLADLLDARKLIEPPSVTRLKHDLSGYDVAEKMWKPSGSIEVNKEDSHFAEWGFRHAFLATSVNPRAQEKWVIKVTKEEHLAPVTENFNITVTQHTRKQVQMHAVTGALPGVSIKRYPQSLVHFLGTRRFTFPLLKANPSLLRNLYLVISRSI